MFKYNHSNFYFNFLENNSLLPFSKNTNSRTTDNELKDISSTSLINQLEDYINIVHYVPYYFELKTNNLPPQISYVDTHRYYGFLIDLEKYFNVDDYMREQLGSHRRQILKRVKRLELCFGIEYKLHIGSISNEIFNSLMIRLKSFIEIRFSQKEAINFQLSRWDNYMNTVYQMILTNKASLFVIYDEREPISISLNYHLEDVMVHSINGYDIDYSKFGLGNTAIFKLVDWCLKNDYTKVDLEWGDLVYKKDWSNVIHRYRTNILYNKDSLGQKIMVYVLVIFIVMKECFEKTKILVMKKVYKLLAKRKLIKYRIGCNALNYVISNVMETISDDKIILIDFKSELYTFLRRAVYDFQYLNFTSSKNVELYKIKDSKDSFIIKGNNKIQKITITAF